MTIRRIFAFFIDAAIAHLLSLVPFLGWIIGFIYMLTRDSLTSQGSPGKKLLNLKVTTVYGQRITYAKSIQRNIIFAIPTLFSIIPVVGWIIGFILAIIIYGVELLAIINNPQRQRFGDRWAGTLVKEAGLTYQVK